jgi:hypothetical protein
MEALSRSSVPEDRHAGLSCAYVLADGVSFRFCSGVPRRGSSYCPEHHALCHVASGTMEEARRLREVEELARVVGGRRGAEGVGPSAQFLKRLERALRSCS